MGMVVMVSDMVGGSQQPERAADGAVSLRHGCRDRTRRRAYERAWTPEAPTREEEEQPLLRRRAPRCP